MFCIYFSLPHPKPALLNVDFAWNLISLLSVLILIVLARPVGSVHCLRQVHD